jgi:tetratricopeptide (TPR) repeat protein
VEKGSIYFLFNGNETSREVAKIGRIAVDDEPALTAAEEAFSRQQWDEAADGFEKAARSSAKPWVRDWAAARLAEAAGKSGRFDAAVAAYVALVQKDPEAAAKAQPALPPGRSTYLDTGAQLIEKTLSTSRLTDRQQAQLLAFLTEIQVARGDSAAANAALRRLEDVLARDPSNPAAARAQVRRTLQSAGQALAAGKFDQAIATLQTAGDTITEPTDQAEALFLIAEARLAQAGAARPPQPAQLQDAALAYMRVVAHFRDAPGRPRVAASLLKTASICSQLGDREAALRLYDEVIRDFSDDKPAAQSAAAAASALRGQ